MNDHPPTDTSTSALDVLLLERTERRSELAFLGDLDAGTRHVAIAAIADEMRPGRDILIDLSGVDVVDSAGIDAILRAHVLHRNRNRADCMLTNTSPSVRRTITLTWLRNEARRQALEARTWRPEDFAPGE